MSLEYHMAFDTSSTRLEDDTIAINFCDTYSVVYGIHAPNSLDLLARIVDAFQKVLNYLDQVLLHANDTIYPGVDGRLKGTR